MSFGLVMIMKNEEKILPTCLESVWRHISYWTICDTGSTDNSCQVVTDFFKEKGVPGQLLHHEWKGFAHNRSLAFAAAEDKTGWMFVIDCDDYLLTLLEIPQECADADSLIILLEEGEYTTQKRQQIFRSGLKWGYTAAVHEVPYSKIKEHPVTLITDKIRVRASRGGDRSKNPLKYWIDAQLMEADLQRIEKIPKNKLPHWEKTLESRYHHYIAQSYHDFNDWQSCIKWCDSRIKLNDFREEIYRAYLMKARCLRYLRSPHKQVIEALEETRKYDPYRSEHLFELAVEYENIYEEQKRKVQFLLNEKPEGEEEMKKHKELIAKEQNATKVALEKAWGYIDQVFQVKRPKDKLFIVEDFVYTIGKLDKAASLAGKMGKWEQSYAYAHDLWKECNKESRSFAYKSKHRYIYELVKQYSETIVSGVNIKSPNDQNIVFNLTFSDFKSAQITVASFIATVVDYANIDGWYVNSDDSDFHKS